MNELTLLFMDESFLAVDWREHGVKIIRAGQLDSNTPQTPGMERAAAITHARTGADRARLIRLYTPTGGEAR